MNFFTNVFFFVLFKIQSMCLFLPRLWKPRNTLM